MTWREWHAARQHLAEERLGTLIRQKQREEDDRFAKTRARLR